MAEKSSELERIETNENLLEISEPGQPPATGEFDADAALAETADTDDAQQIREQIEETRSHMSETIDAIQERLSVANITEQVKDQVTEQISDAVETAKGAFYDKANDFAKSVGKSFAQVRNSDLARKAQENPWVISVVGMGIGAVLVGALAGGRKRKRKGSYDYKNYVGAQTRQRFDSSQAGDYESQTRPTKTSGVIRPSKFGEGRDETAKVSEAKDRTGASNVSSESNESAVKSVYQGISSAAGKTYETVGSAAGKTYETVGKASGFAYEKAGDLGEAAMKNYKQYIEENPLAVGAVALAVGAAVGYAIPLTQTENQYFGEVRDKILDKAETSAQDAIGSVKQAVGDARQVIADEVKSQTASK